MVIENVTVLPLEATIQSMADTVRPLFLKLSVMLGGIFGLYVILIVARVHYERKKVKILKQIRYDLDHLNQHYDLPYSRGVRPLWRRALGWIRTKIFGKRDEAKQDNSGRKVRSKKGK